MEGNERREKLIDLLQESTQPISGSQLSKLLGVSRQVIVQDIALLRANGHNLLSTTKGYVIVKKSSKGVQRKYYVKHKTSQIEDELCTIVDNGGRVLDVCVSHPIYGQIATALVIKNRNDVYEFVKKVNEKQTRPLKELTGDEHYHTVEADSEEILDRIEEALNKKKYLIHT